MGVRLNYKEKYGSLKYFSKKYAFAMYVVLKFSVITMKGAENIFSKNVRKYFGKKYGPFLKTSSDRIPSVETDQSLRSNS